MSNPLFDKQFLKLLDQYPHKETYIRIISLDYNDVPLEKIEGFCTGGSINVDGASALRRTCSLSIVSPLNTTITDYHWAFNHKFKVEIGLANFIDNKYDKIIWFPQGTYIVNSFSKSENTTGLTISISGQDKMCRLNGTISGNIPVEVDFANIDEIQEDGSIVKNKILLYDTIQMAVHEYGQERKENILINDLDMQGLELWDYRGNIPLYLYYKPADWNSSNTYGSVLGVLFGTTDKAKIDVKEFGSDWKKKKISELNQYYQLNDLDGEINKTASYVKYSKTGSGTNFVGVVKIEYGETAGYHQTPLTYAGDLIVKAGTSVSTGVLDKVKNMLGEYEYFYDLNGRFVFQKKKTYINELFSPINGEIVEPMMTLSPYAYDFEDKTMFTNISYSPQVTDIKNDFVIWGTKSNGMPIHVRYAIQKKPSYYKSCGSYNKKTHEWSGGEVYRTSPRSETDPGGHVVDWREIIYQMAKDYNNYNQYPDFYHRIDTQNTWTNGQHCYPDGKTGFEQYYTDMISFWRYLYDLNPEENKKDRYYPYQEYYDKNSSIKPGWNKLIHTNPENLIFWFDFLDVGNAPLSEYSVDSIGSRTKIENVSGNCQIYIAQTPEVLYTVGDEDVIETKDTTAFAISNIGMDKKELFNVAAVGTSLISKANELIYQHACCAEAVNLTCVPIYYLEPNTRIYVKDIGDLIVTKISYNLVHGGTMSLTCTKVIQSIY